jgi:hypothetical protein
VPALRTQAGAVPGSVSEEGDALARIGVHLGAVLQSPTASFGQKQLALNALSTIHTSAGTNLLERGLEESNPSLRLNAASFLLLRDDLSGIGAAEQALTHPQSILGNLLHNLNFAIGEGVKNQKAVPTLSRLAHVAYCIFPQTSTE